MDYRLPGNIKACVFDAYGTLFDVNSIFHGLRTDLAALGVNWQEFSNAWRNRQLQYTWIRSLSGQYADFWKVTGDALDFALDAFNIRECDLRDKLFHLYLQLLPYPECKQVLEQLRGTGLKLAILSNGTNNMLQSAVANACFDDHFDAILSAEESKIFKPHPSVYHLAERHLDVATRDICFVSANGWDAWSAKAYGFHVVWCNRSHQPPERLPFVPDAMIRTLSEIAL